LKGGASTILPPESPEFVRGEEKTGLSLGCALSLAEITRKGLPGDSLRNRQFDFELGALH